MTMLRRSSSGRRCAIETLESRQLLAGNVTFKIVNGNAVIKGDKAANIIAVSSPVAGSVTVAGTNTTINGVVGPVTLTGFTGNLKIQMGQGNDDVIVNGMNVSGNANIRLGRGNDFLDVATQNSGLNSGNVAVTGALNVRARAGQDTVAIGHITTEEDDPNVSASAGSLTVRMGKQNDSLNVVRTTVAGSTRLRGGRGTNTVNNVTAAAALNNFATAPVIKRFNVV